MRTASATGTSRRRWIGRSAQALALTAASSCVGRCGARTELATQAGPRAPHRSCRAVEHRSARKVWQVSLPNDQAFTGPWAADDAGTTYFLGTSPAQYPTTYTIAALDSCGALRWQSAPRPPGFLNGASPDVVVDGDRVLFQWGTVDAFDRMTGAHLWNVDLDAYAGEKLAGDDFAEIGPLAVSADGTAFLTMTYGTRAVILSIDATGTPQTVANVSGDTGDLSGFVLDAADHLDILFNSVDGEIVTSYARDGSKVFSSAFACNIGFLGPLAAGSSFVVMQSGPCGMDLTGASLFSPPNDDSAQSVTIDATNNLYLAGGNAFASLDPTGSPRWTTPGSDFVVSAPLLATQGQVFTAQLPASIASTAGPLSIVSYDAATGVELARYPTDAMVPGGSIPTIPTLVTAAAQVVFSVGGTATAIAVGQTADNSAQWPTGAGGPDRRNAALGH